MEGGRRGVGWVTGNGNLRSSALLLLLGGAKGNDVMLAVVASLSSALAHELGEVVHPVDCRSAKGCTFQYPPWTSCWNRIT